MDEQPNVNNLNGVPYFGHGIPSGGTTWRDVAAFAAEPEAVDIATTTDTATLETPSVLPDTPTEPVQVDITNQ